jgi:signal transduction histidine kinase
MKQQLEVIIRSANRLKAIIEDLSNVNDYQAGTSRLRHRLLSINQVIQKVVNSNMESARQKNIAFAARVPDTELIVDADEEKITIAINNLVTNAIGFTDQNGHILVSAERLPGYIQVSVIDDGIGIPAKDLPRVFDRFFQVQSHLTRRHGGMGLGLSVAKAMIELHKGQIWVESVEGKGSKFSFILPTTKTVGMGTNKVSAFLP